MSNKIKIILEKFYLQRSSKFLEVDFKNIIRKVMESQYWEDDRLKEFQKIQLNNLYSLIKDNIFYNKKYCNNFNVSNILNGEVKISKNELRDSFTELYQKTSKKEFEHITSGSTGLPVKVVSSAISEAERTAQRLRFYSWWGISLYGRSVLIWGKLQFLSENRKTIKNFVKNWIGPSVYFINVFSLNHKTITDHYKKIKKFKAEYIRGYTSGVYQFCSLLEEKGLNGKAFGFKVAIVTSEILLPEHRRYIQEILGCPVANEYGAAEVGLIAYDCEFQNLHICQDLIIPFIDSNGEIYLTDMYNEATPLLNYRLGDVVTLSDTECKCGRKLPVIKNVNGRTGDFIRKPDGSYISQYLFYYIVKDLDNIGLNNSIAQYKIVQSGFNFDVKIVKGKNFSEKSIDYLKNRMYSDIGKDITVNVSFVEKIPKEKSGKLRFFERID